MKVRIYEYGKCSTCRNALKFLDRKGVQYERVSIVDTPPTLQELKLMLGEVGGDIRRLFNTSGQVYRELKIGEKLPGLSTDQAFDLLAKHGKLVKRPFAVLSRGGGKKGLVGFREDEWKKAFAAA